MHALAPVQQWPLTPNTGAAVMPAGYKPVSQTAVEPDAVAVQVHAQVLEHLTERGYVSFHPRLADRFGYRAALFLGTCLYWTRRSVQYSPASRGWFYLTAKQISDVTTLTRHEQDTVRTLLRNEDILHERKGRNAVTHYRLNLRQLADALAIVNFPPNEQLDIEDAWSWFEKSVTFYRPLADLAGSAAGGLYLSWLLRLQLQSFQKQRQVVYVAPDAASAELRLTAKVLRTTRERLRRQGLIVENGIWTQPNLSAILACIRQQTIAPLPIKARRAKPETAIGLQKNQPSLRKVTHQLVPNPANRPLLPQSNLAFNAPASLPIPGGDAWNITTFIVAGNPQLQSVQPLPAEPISPLQERAHPDAQSGKPDAQSGKPVDNFEGADAQSGKPGCPNRQTGCPIRQTIINTIKNNNKKTTTTRAREDGAVDKSCIERQACRRRLSEPENSKASLEGLIYPDGLAPQVIPGIQDVLRQVSVELRQALLDDLQGQLRLPNKTIHNPAGWLAALARRVSQEGLTLPLAESVAALRRQQQTVQRQIAESVTATSEPVSPPSAEVRQQLRELRERYTTEGGK